MDWLENELKQALQRKDPSADFEARVTAAAKRRRKVVPMPRWLAAAAAVVVITAAGAGYRYHQGQVAKEQVMQAMRLAGSKLNHVQLQMRTRP